MHDEPSDTPRWEQPVEAFLTALAAARQRHARADVSESDLALALAVGLLRYRRCGAGLRPPVQVVVAGPTQAGKSTAVNWLFGRAVAEASPLAGYTRHAQGFASPALTEDTLAGLACVFGATARVDCVELRARDEDDAWCIEDVPGAPVFEQPAVIWDSPDFDSVNSRRYRATAFRLFALADVVLFMVSKEKYADRTVWSALELLKPLAMPTLICVNKLPETGREPLLASLGERLAHAGIDARVLPVIYAHAPRPAGAEALSRTLREVLAEPRVAPRDRDVRPFLRRHWDAWCEPVRAEYRQGALWRERVDAAVDAAGEAYQTQYLNAPHYAATLQRAMVRLLELLEIPGLAEPLVRARKVLTWPARRIRDLLGSARRAVGAPPDRERDILAGVLRQALADLQQRAMHLSMQSPETAAPWWKRLFAVLYELGPELDRRGERAIERYQADFTAEVDAAARQLFDHLKQHPATLNSLRAARVTADAAGLVIALKTGGIGLNDLILTPAMLSFTSTLTEGAVGGYMYSVESRLKARQRQLVREALFDGVLRQTLLEAPRSMGGDELLAIDEALYLAAETAMQPA